MRTLGIFVQQRRQAMGKRGDEIAFALGKSPSWISRLESGVHKTLPEPEVLRVLARELGVSVPDLLIGAGYLEPSDLHPEASASRNPFSPGDSRHEAVELLLANDASFEQVVKSVLALRRSSRLAPELDQSGRGEHPEEERGD